MDVTNKLSSFLTEDVAYLLGLIVGRGTLVPSNDTNKLIIEFPFKNLEVTNPADENRKLNTQMHIVNSLDKIVERLKRLGLDVSKKSDENSKKVSLVISSRSMDLAWQLLNYLLNGQFGDYHSFRIPKAVFQSDMEVRKEFLRGYFDVTGHVRSSNAAFGNEDQQRVYLEVDHRNWFLVLDIYKLLEGMGVPVQGIDFGHPNFRDPQARGRTNAWAKEHQVKIYANQFLRIGSYLSHKQEVLEALAKMNKEGLGDSVQESRVRPKKENPGEKSKKLPKFLQGKHFDHYLELLEALEENDKIRAYE